MRIVMMAALLGAMLLPGTAPAQWQDALSVGECGRRTYWGYPYYRSWGVRSDPYWSQQGSYYPSTYQGDGSYYGLGYSGYGGRGGHGSYWYW